MTPANSCVVRFLPLVTALAAGLAPGNSASAAQKTLSWDDDACTYRISFDPAKHDEKRLNNTIRLLFARQDWQLRSFHLVADPQAAAKTRSAQIDRQCSDVLKTVRELELALCQGIEDYRRALIGEIDDTCRFGNAEIRGLRDPSALREYTRAPACSHFIDALEGKSDIDKVFRETVLPAMQQQRISATVPRRNAQGSAEAGRQGARAVLSHDLRLEQLRQQAHRPRSPTAKALEKLRCGSREAVPAHVHGSQQVRESRLSGRGTRLASVTVRRSGAPAPGGFDLDQAARAANPYGGRT